MPGIRSVVLRSLLRTLEPGGLRRLRQMHARADPPQLLDHEPPPRRRLQRNLELATAEPRQPLPHVRAIRWRHTRALHLAGIGIDPLAGDLSTMLVKSHYDAHLRPPQAPRSHDLRGHSPRLSWGGLHVLGQTDCS